MSTELSPWKHSPSVEFKLGDDEPRRDVLRWTNQVTMHERGLLSVQAVCAAHDLSRGVDPHMSKDNVRRAESLSVLGKRTFVDAFILKATAKSIERGQSLDTVEAKRCAETVHERMPREEISNSVSAYRAAQKRAKRSASILVAELNGLLQKYNTYAGDLERMVQVENDLHNKVSRARQLEESALEHV